MFKASEHATEQTKVVVCGPRVVVGWADWNLAAHGTACVYIQLTVTGRGDLPDQEKRMRAVYY